jgi:hypothetical protein
MTGSRIASLVFCNHSLPSPEFVEGEPVSTGSTYGERERLRFLTGTHLALQN